jgi:hypothetical protein
MTRRWRWAAGGLIAAALLLYLRDPAWLIDTDFGFFDWERNRAGQRLRWMGSHSSFFVPSDAKFVTIPLHALFLTDDRSPFVIRIEVNDRPATQVILRDDEWQSVRLPIVLPERWSRKVARIDLRANRTWSERAISVQVGEPIIEK